MTITPVTLADLTSATVEGTGVFDVLMKANKAHLEQEFLQNRIKGPEYATVYLGSLESVLAAAVAFLLQKDKNALEAQLLEQQILLAQVEITKATAQLAGIEAQTALSGQQLLNLQAELEIIQANVLKVPAEIALLEAQTALSSQQKLNLVDELLTSVEQRAKLVQETANAVIEGTVLTAQKCKLDAEFDVLMETKLKTTQETGLLLWKTNTEKAQTVALGVDDNSVIGKQKVLYQAQATGFTRDAEQKAAKVMIDTWNVRRTTDEATVADATNLLNDASVGRAVTKLLAGVGA